jgi:hypothetical protein
VTESEIWKDIPGEQFEGYQASDMGNIRSKDRIITTSAGVVKRHKGKVLNPTPPKPTAPYRMVTINGKNYRVAPLILTTFVKPKPYPKAEARHLNDDKSDDRLVNLAWGTKSQNTSDSVRNLSFNRPWRYKQKKKGS